MEATRPCRPIDTYYTSYNMDFAAEFIRESANFARALSAVAFSVGESIFEKGNAADGSKDILAKTIRFKNGKRIVALSSAPRNLRGIKGRLVLDEFAFIDNPSELLKAAMATLIWGGRVSVISTHNGVENPFNTLVTDVKAGKLAYSLHEIDIDEALKQGLYRRICVITEKEWSESAQEQWRANLIAFYGDGADEELFCVPSRSGGIYLPHGLVEGCMHRDFKVWRFRAEDSLVHAPQSARDELVDGWIRQLRFELLPKLSERPTFLGQDFGRISDLSVWSIGQQDQDIRLQVPGVIELRNVPFDAQQRFAMSLCRLLPKFSRAAVDSTGNGAPLGEKLQQEFGESIIDRVGIAGNGWATWYPENLPRFKAAFESQNIRIPHDIDIRSDLAMFRTLNGKPQLPAVKAQSKAKEAKKGDYRHGDAGVSLALLEYAARSSSSGPIKYSKLDRVRGGMWGHKGAW